VRLDQLLVSQGLANSRTLSQKLIAAGLVEGRIAGKWQLLSKPSLQLNDDAQLRVHDSAELRYVSRAGLKLEGALAHFNIDVRGLRALDVGQSTGGFSDCLVQHGVEEVVGIDVGHGQLAVSLLNHSKIRSFEGVNARSLSPSLFNEADLAPHFDLVVMDVSFISQTLILPQLAALMHPAAHLLSLVKPQFEVGKSGLGKGGIVRNRESYALVEKKIREHAAHAGFDVLGYGESAISGGDGNREFFLSAQLSGP